MPNLNFGDVAGALGSAMGGVAGGMEKQQNFQQEMALRKALQDAQIGNYQSEAQYRTAEGARQTALTSRLTEQDTRRRAMVPHLLQEINDMRKQVGEPGMDATNPEQYDPDFLQQESLRLTTAVEGERARRDTWRLGQQSHADIVRERKRGAIQNELQAIEAEEAKNPGISRLDPNSKFFNPFVHSRYLDLQRQRKQMDNEDLGGPARGEPHGQAKVPTASPSASPDTPGQKISTSTGSPGSIPTGMEGGVPDLSGTASAESIGAASETGQPSTAQGGAMDLAQRRADYANKLAAQGIPYEIARARTLREVPK